MEDIHKQTLLQSREALLKTSESITRSQQAAIENEEIATGVLGELESQRESLLRTRNTLIDTDYELTRTQQLIRMIQRSVIANKLFLILIIIGEILILISIIYVKFLR